ncbi:MAG: MATE family efflux transporter [Lachnospiraceae bacterium]|nr:MATE family efflux transporter [Lachnospiraceae bacterium]
MGEMIKNRKNETFRILLFLALPTMLEHLLSTLMQYVDTAMVGRLGADATAAVSTTTTITWLTGSLSAAVAVSCMTMIATAIGARDTERVRKIASQSVLLAILTGGLIMIVSIVLSPVIPVWMGIDVSVQKAASDYFLIISIPAIFRSLSIILSSAVRATHDTKNPMIISLSSNALNVVLNAVLIYGLHLDVTGAALATAISTVVSGVWMLVLFLRTDVLRFSRRDLKPDKEILSENAKLSLPVLATAFTSCMGYVVFAGMITGLGKVIFAAHSIAVTAEELFYLPGYGLRSATQTLVGNSIGERDRNKFRGVSRAGIVITVVLMTFSGLLLFVCSYPLMCVFTRSEEVARTGAYVLKMVAFTEPFFGLQVVLEGIFYGVGKTRFPFLVDTLSMWGIRILFTFLCVNVWGLGLRSVWICMIVDNLCKAFVFAIASPKTFRRAFQKADFTKIEDQL